jgi:hypothetical protein
MWLFQLLIAAILLLAFSDRISGQPSRPVEVPKVPKKREFPPEVHHPPELAGHDKSPRPQFREDVPKWAQVVAFLLLAGSVAAVVIAFHEVESKTKWALGSVVLLGSVFGILYLANHFLFQDRRDDLQRELSLKLQAQAALVAQVKAEV